VRRVCVSVLCGAVLGVGGMIILGTPSPKDALAFLTNGIPTTRQAVASASFLCWIVIAIGWVAASYSSLTPAARRAWRNPRLVYAVTMSCIGLLFLSIGILRRITSADSMCCVTTHDLEEALRLVR
jgi:nitric oxide reductase large subunit